MSIKDYWSSDESKKKEMQDRVVRALPIREEMPDAILESKVDKRDWQEQCTVENIDRCLEETMVYIRIIPGEEWALWKVGKYYRMQRVLPTKGEGKSGTDLTELLLWFVVGDAIRKGQYEPLPSGNIVSFSQKRAKR